MFTGIIRYLGKIEAAEDIDGQAKLLTIGTPLAPDLKEGDSIAVNGVCLTVLATNKNTWQARLMAETLNKTNLGSLTVGQTINLEHPMTASQFVDGHFVQGHVDGICTIAKISTVGQDKIFTFEGAADLVSYLIPKGSVSLDGVSLTVVDVNNNQFTVSVMPYTLEMTTFGQRSQGDIINLEVDMLSKYVKSFMNAREAALSSQNA